MEPTEEPRPGQAILTACLTRAHSTFASCPPQLGCVISNILDISKIEGGHMSLEDRELSLEQILKDAFLIARPKVSLALGL